MFFASSLQAIFNYKQFNSKKYQKKTRFAKSDLLWKEFLKNPTKILTPVKKKSLHREALVKSVNSYKYIFNFNGDAVSLKEKFYNREGLISKCEFLPTKASKVKYTGIFKGSDAAFLRFSLKEDFKSSKKEKKNLYANVGIKFMRNKVPSGNALFFMKENEVFPDKIKLFKNSMISYRSVESYFVKGKISLPNFDKFNPYFYQMGLFELGDIDQNGNKLKKPKFPYSIKIIPGKSFKKNKDIHKMEDFTKELKKIKKGTAIYQVYGIENPKFGCEIHLGKIITKSKFISSEFSDKNLFFKHGSRVFDLIHYPHWIKYSGFLYKNKKHKGLKFGKCQK